MVNYESIYPGALYTTQTPSFYTEPIANYQANISSIGIAADARTANQLGALNTSLNPGAKTIEVGAVSPEVFQSIPEQHLDEMKRLSKLTGVQTTLHAPITEASGVGEQGFTEENRLGAEKQMESAVLRGHKLDPEGNISVTFHSTAQLPEMRPHIKDKKGKKIEQGLWIINEESGQMGQIKPEKRYFPEEGKFTEKEIEFEAKKELERRNRETWTESISGINRTADFGEDHFRRAKTIIMDVGSEITKIGDPEERRKIADEVITDVSKAMAKGTEGQTDLEKLKQRSPGFRQIIENTQRDISSGQIYLRDSYKNMKSFFDKAWNNVENEEDRQKLREFARKAAPKITKDLETDFNKVGELRQVVQDGLKTLSNLNQTPEIFQPLNEFVIKKSAETFANVAETAYKKFGETSPIVNIENPPGGSGLSTGEDLKKLVEASRKQLSENLSKKGMSNSQAKNVAEKMI